MIDRVRPRRRSLAVLAFAVALAVLLAPRLGRADVTAECDFLEFSATSGDKPAIDGELQQLNKSLAKKKTEPISLKNGSATATLVEIVDKSKVRLTVIMEDAKGKQVANNT